MKEMESGILRTGEQKNTIWENWIRRARFGEQDVISSKGYDLKNHVVF